MPPSNSVLQKGHLMNSKNQTMEAAALAVYEFIREQVSEEIDAAQELDCWWRTLILRAWCERCHDFREEYASGTGPSQPITSSDRYEWEFKMDGLEEEVLEDRRCLSERVMELDPGTANRRYRGSKFPQTYYTAAAPSVWSKSDRWLFEILELLERYYSELDDEAASYSAARDGAEVERGAAARRGA